MTSAILNNLSPELTSLLVALKEAGYDVKPAWHQITGDLPEVSLPDRPLIHGSLVIFHRDEVIEGEGVRSRCVIVRINYPRDPNQFPQMKASELVFNLETDSAAIVDAIRNDIATRSARALA